MAEEKVHVHGISYVLYYIVLFFAYWFGSSRFDMDGDGDFDPEDVQAYLADKGFLQKNFKQSKTARSKQKKQRTSRKKSKEGTSSSQLGTEASDSAVAGGASSTQPDGDGSGSGHFLDRNGDGKVDIDDAFESKVDGPAVEDEVMQNLMEKQILPWFIILECTICFALWLAFSIKISSDTGSDPLQVKAGLDSFDDKMTDLRLSGGNCEDYRFQAWRWLTYQFTHVGAMHVLMNVFLNIMLGVPLEGLHGAWRMALMFNIGVFGGACFYFINDSHTAVVGCSGGCYALIGMHLADLIMNFRQKKFRVPTIVFLIVLVGVDIFSYVMSLSAENASHSAHIGGGIAGLIIGVMIGKNLKVLKCEKVLMGVVGVLGVGMAAGCVTWLAINPAPLNLWESMRGEQGYCWIRQFYNASINEWAWECVRCGTQDCMDLWSKQRYLEPVNTAVCLERGWYYDGR